MLDAGSFHFTDNENTLFTTRLFNERQSPITFLIKAENMRLPEYACVCVRHQCGFYKKFDSPKKIPLSSISIDTSPLKLAV